MAIKRYKTVFSLIIIIVFSSCSMQKRLYTKGFYSHKNQTAKKPEAIAKTDTMPSIALTTTKIKDKNANLVATNADFIISNSILLDACDTIILKSGAKLTVSIKDASTTDIKYRTCPLNNGLILNIKRTDVSSIHYGNGRKEVFEEEHIYNQPANLPEGKFIANNQPSRNNKQENSGKTTDGFAIAGFVLGFVPLQVGLIFAVLNAIGNITLGSGGLSAVSSLWFAIPLLFAFISFVLCLTAIIRISRNKETKKGLSMAVFGLILSLIAIMVLLALVVSA